MKKIKSLVVRQKYLLLVVFVRAEGFVLAPMLSAETIEAFERKS